MQTQIQEVLDRTRRIETKLTRMIVGDPDKGVTKQDYMLEDAGPFFKLHLRSSSITLVQLSEILSAELLEGDEVDVFENGRFLISVKMR